ncbi:MAG: tripartite tricarboxylate transporter substrate binding protein [Proteobacteria bacterium]|nr:tripartite tricarboxylate transporter substrate binding protein [Pseudomonadota bacterium]
MTAAGIFKAALAAMLAAASCGAWAQAYPAKPVKLIVTYPPAGGADTMARLIAAKLSESLGQPVVVENRPGASGQIGADAVARAAPDGYTLMLDASSYAVNPSLYPKLPYDPQKAFAPITLLAQFPNMLVVTPSFPVNSVKDLVAMAKAKPGTISYASSGNGSAQHLAAELFKQQAGVDIMHVPYKGGGPAMTDVMAGQVPVFFANMASGLGHVKGGKLKALAATGSKRSPNMPELPTLAESGVPGYEVYEWNAVFAPAGTPPAIVNLLYEHIAKALALKDVRERIDALGGEIVASNPRDTEKFLVAQMAKWSKVVKQGNIKVE